MSDKPTVVNLEEAVKKLEQEPSVSQLTSNDQTLFHTHTASQRPKDNQDFKDSWLYIRQATRTAPLKYRDPKSSTFIPFSVREHQPAIIIPNYFILHPTPAAPKELEKVARTLSKITSLPVILKNVDPKDAPRLKLLGFDTYKQGEHWSGDAHYDDQTFPQRIADIEEVKKMQGRPFARLRNMLNRFSGNSNDIQTRLYKLEDKSHALAFAEEAEAYLPGFLDAHYPFFATPPPPNTYYFTHTINGQVAGVTICDKISPTTVAWCAHLYDRSTPNLSAALAFATITAVDRLEKESFTHINFQGSESEGLDFWKSAFCPNPDLAITKTHLIYRPK